MLIIYAKKENDTCFCCNGYNVMVVIPLSNKKSLLAVSYTHLTLPTNREV